jgi:hypothetical protein
MEFLERFKMVTAGRQSLILKRTGSAFVATFLVMMPCSLIGYYQCSRGTRRLHLQSRRMEAIDSSETLVTTCKTILSYNPKDHKQNFHNHENVKARFISCFSCISINAGK